MVMLVEVAGFFCLAGAAWMFNVTVGLACSGALLLVLGWLLDAAGVEPRLPRRRRRPAKDDS